MLCLNCDLWSETKFNNDGISSVDFCPLCGVELDETEWLEDEDENEQ